MMSVITSIISFFFFKFEMFGLSPLLDNVHPGSLCSYICNVH